MNFWRAALELIEARRAGALATVAHTSGSTPVPAGTKMLVGDGGRLLGTVGGGCVEADVLQAAIDAQQRRAPALVTHHLNADLAGDLGLSCGGTVEIFVEPLVAEPAYVAALEAAAAADAGVVRTAAAWDVAAGPIKPFAPPPPGAEPGVPAALSADRRFVVERFALAPRVLVFGAGHVGAAIARAAAAAGFRVVVVDDRSEYADPGRFGGEMTVLAGGVEDALTRFPLTVRDAVVVATRGHRHDALIVERVAPSPAGYGGLLGSRRQQAGLARAPTAAGGAGPRP